LYSYLSLVKAEHLLLFCTIFCINIIFTIIGFVIYFLLVFIINYNIISINLLNS